VDVIPDGPNGEHLADSRDSQHAAGRRGEIKSTMRRFRIVLLSIAFACSATLAARPEGQTPEAPAIDRNAPLVYVGTYTTGKSTSKGIYLFQLQSKGNVDTLVPLGVAGETVNPSFLDIDRRRRLLFAVSEVNNFEGKTVGAVSAFSIDPATGKLTLINQQPSMGTGPCHLVLDKAGKHVLVANYGSGSIAVLPVASDGRLGEPTATVQHTGSSVNPQRQKGPHAHCLILDPANRFAFACDLGLDKVMVYRYDADKGTLTPHDPAFAAVEPGAGPRDMVFRPDGRFAYVGNEMASTITAFSYDAGAGRLTEIQAISTLPADFQGQNSIAELAVHPSGKYVYISNRGHNSVAAFSVDSAKGTLTLLQHQDTGGRTPRHFGIDADARHLIMANQQSDSLLVSRIDNSGRLTPSGELVSAPTPVYVAFLPADARR
jgi:6-phosphogluconolactonase